MYLMECCLQAAELKRVLINFERDNIANKGARRTFSSEEETVTLTS